MERYELLHMLYRRRLWLIIIYQSLFLKYLNAINYLYVMLISVIFSTSSFQFEYFSVINYLSSIVKWDYQANFKPLLFSWRKDFTRTKSTKTTFILLKVFAFSKNRIEVRNTFCFSLFPIKVSRKLLALCLMKSYIWFCFRGTFLKTFFLV